MSHQKPTAWPLADAALTQKLLNLLQQAMHYDQVKKGANEVMKSLTRGISEIVVLAADTVPLAILMNIPALRESKNVLYVFVPSKQAMGRACGISRPISAITMNSNDASELAHIIEQTKNKVERLSI
ncbi:Ribosomal protein L7Ae/L30e/S12e/Gadd45 [Penicillium griseofulvum]|uniref:H/ACA ribonucleoprotein complex subunit 2 n=1 Tax=Penicillium patulum TaxID=5078 RepID=A0A135LK38_PENPA|nr:Ribosomal protein L7Ae/L30e/S12e/Gadd45 [Penicillium griseofulvum]KXG49288.1 Ribosomal protein L7Ae/L30e/S12e/Gadd45 [Penicillium griseofulvum]